MLITDRHNKTGNKYMCVDMDKLNGTLIDLRSRTRNY